MRLLEMGVRVELGMWSEKVWCVQVTAVYCNVDWPNCAIPQTVNAIETGKYAPSLPLAFKIAHLFGQPIEEIFEPDADP